jgi:hypothetical protein
MQNSFRRAAVRRAAAPDFQDRIGERKDDGAEDQACRAEDREASHDGEKDRHCVQAQPNKHRVEQIIDERNDNAAPMQSELSLFPTAHGGKKKMAAGSQITNAPSTGTIASNAGAGRPSHQNINPPSAPCTAATTSVPKIVA